MGMQSCTGTWCCMGMQSCLPHVGVWCLQPCPHPRCSSHIPQAGLSAGNLKENAINGTTGKIRPYKIPACWGTGPFK